MKHRARFSLILIKMGILVLFFRITVMPAMAGQESPMIVYELDATRPQTHLYSISISAPTASSKQLDFALPAWLPGYNRNLHFAKNVQEFSATGSTGRSLSWSKTDDQTWCIPCKGESSVSIRYKVFANDLAEINLSAHLDVTHAFFNGAAVFLYIKGMENLPVSLKILKPEGWAISTGLRKTRTPGMFMAAGYDELIDCPTEIGRHRIYRFQVRRIPHEIALYGLGPGDCRFIVDDLSRIIETAADIFRGLPYSEYTFIYHFTDRKKRSGVEHANSTAIIFNKWDFISGKGYDDFLSVTAHEFFHVWNIKRIRPIGWGPFDYTTVPFTSSHWFSEGMTVLYQDLLLVRSGIWNKNKFYTQLAQRIQEFERKPGKKMMSLSDASWNIHHKGDNRDNTTVSYYEKGGVVALLFDLTLRHLTRNRQSFDDVFRCLDREFGDGNRPYQESDLRDTIEKISGSDLSRFFSRYIDGTSDLSYNEILSRAGLRLVRNPVSISPYLGITLESGAGGFIRIQKVAPGSPAEQAGFDSGDILLAINDQRIESLSAWSALFNLCVPGRETSITYFHRDRLMRRIVIPSEITETEFIIEEIERPDADALNIRRALFSEQQKPRESAVRSRDLP